MSKIDLSKAKIGDKFRTRNGKIVEYVGRFSDKTTNQYILEDERGLKYYFYKYGNYTLIAESKLDLIEQVFDKGDLLDNNISAEERVQALVGMAKSEYEEAKELGAAIQNLPHIVEQPKEDNQELQRRQEVVELAEKMYIMHEFENMKYYLSNGGNNAFESKDLVEMAFIRAASFINKKHQYLKEGKLC